MPPRFILLLVLLPTVLAAEVYRSIGPDGRPVFTDRPVPNATKLDLPAATPRTAPNAASSTPVQGDSTGFPGPYTEFEIVTPADNTTIRSAVGELQIGVLLDPPLQDGHHLAVEIDGASASGDLGNRTQFQLTGLTLGSHSVQAQVADDTGAAVAATPVINVHVRPPLPEGAPP
jgi:hypothetical protein